MGSGTRIDGIMAVLVENLLCDVDSVASFRLQFDVNVNVDSATLGRFIVGSTAKQI